MERTFVYLTADGLGIHTNLDHHILSISGHEEVAMQKEFPIDGAYKLIAESPAIGFYTPGTTVRAIPIEGTPVVTATHKIIAVQVITYGNKQQWQ